jgi:hypothetical protein
MPSSSAATPRLLQVCRERLKPGADTRYAQLEEEIAALLAAHGCPHPYVGALNRSADAGPAEVWWLNEYRSADEVEDVANAYAANASLMGMLASLPRRKEELVAEVTDSIATLRDDLGRGPPWQPAGARFLVFSVTTKQDGAAASVFEAPDGIFYLVRHARTEREAEAIAAAIENARVFAIRPEWSVPDQAWVQADPQFWSASPAVSAHR